MKSPWLKGPHNEPMSHTVIIVDEIASPVIACMPTTSDTFIFFDLSANLKKIDVRLVIECLQVFLEIRIVGVAAYDACKTNK